MTTAPPLVRRPTEGASALALLGGILALGVVADAGVQRRILAIAAAGVAVFAVGLVGWRRGRPAVGWLVALGGTGVVLYALGLATARPSLYVYRAILVPGVLGLWILAAGVTPLRLGWERPLITAGTGFVFLAVLVAGVVETTGLVPLLAAGALTILAWDAAENAVSLGRQLGDEARTRRAELAHGVASSLVAGGAILLAIAIQQLGIDGLPFAALAALLVAGVALTAVHYR